MYDQMPILKSCLVAILKGQDRLFIAKFLKTDGGVASEKMYTAVKYMLNFWTELIKYTNQGHYTIDNSAAERSIRPLTVGRKNYIHFGSEKSAAFFYSIMATCKMRGANARDYAQMLPGLL